MKVGDKVKTRFGAAANNRWRRGILASILDSDRYGMIRVKQGRNLIQIKRPMTDIFLDD